MGADCCASDIRATSLSVDVSSTRAVSEPLTPTPTADSVNTVTSRPLKRFNIGLLSSKTTLRVLFSTVTDASSRRLVHTRRHDVSLDSELQS